MFYQLKRVVAYIGIPTRIEQASAIHPRGVLAGQHRILEICLREGASTYINPPGGRSLYHPELFASAGIEFRFLDPDLSALTLRHSGGAEGPCLSILDLLMFNSADAVRETAGMYGLSGI